MIDYDAPMAHERHGERPTTAAPLVPYKAGLLLLIGILSAPVVKPLLEKSLKLAVKAGIQVKKAAADANAEFKVLAAEAIQEKYSAEDDRAPASPAPSPPV